MKRQTMKGSKFIASYLKPIRFVEETCRPEVTSENLIGFVEETCPQEKTSENLIGS
jgi:hypothetical protein